MGNFPNPRHIHLLVFLQFFFLVSFSFGLFSPADNHLIDCGSSSAATLHDHRIFLPDTDCRSARLVSRHPKISVASEVNPSFQNAALYQTARVFTSLSSYEFHIASKGNHIIRLHFYPFSTPTHDLTSAQFHVFSSGFVLLTNFTASSDSPSIKEFIIRVDDEKVVIFFAPADSSSFAFVNAIEVISAPGELIGDTARLVQPDEILKFDGLSKQAMATLFRINVGGLKVTPFNDTLWRTWIPDTAFFNSDSVAKIFSFSGRIMYREYGASREVAPDSVYNTARAIDGVVGSSNFSSRITWSFPVDHGYRYLIRMHFCDIASLALNELYFNVYINGYLAYEDFDISSATGQVLASPYYVDFVADVGSSGILHVTVGPSRHGDHSRVDGLLNGIEIMKLSNDVGSLDGELPFALVLHNSTGGSFGSTVRSLVCWFAFVVLSVMGFMMVLRWRRESKKQIAWTPLPMDA
ncbi:putative receptor-like protein kinase [Platanthera zijinensis]|uniref:Receptor-like protein kinase n=1 Tax=Platanthera zijinensis TaxID=2320716 RepID=A0AAP0G3H8_9ASPA